MALPRMGEFSFKHSTQPDKPNMTAAQLKAAFDSQPNEVKAVINAICDTLEKIASTSGAAQIGSEAIAGIAGTTIRDQLVDFLSKLKSVADGSSGADFVNVTGVAGLTGGTVQSVLESLKSYIDTVLATHKTSTDHDGRYYTETELNNGQLDTRYYTETELNAGQLDTRYFTETELNNGQLDNRYFTETELGSTTAGTSGAHKVGSAPITGVTGATIYAQLADLKSQINAAIVGDIPDGSITPAKLSFDPATQAELDAHANNRNNHIPYAVTQGIETNAYNVTLSPAAVSYVEGMAVSVKIHSANSGASTINVNNLGAKPIKKANGNDVPFGSLRADSVYTLRYNGLNFILQGEAASGNATASDLRSGKTASTDAGDITGNVPVQTGGNVVPGATDIVKPSGIYDAPITVKGVVVPPAKVLNDTIIAGTQGAIIIRASGTGTVWNGQGPNGNLWTNPAQGYWGGGGIDLDTGIPWNAGEGVAARAVGRNGNDIWLYPNQNGYVDTNTIVYATDNNWVENNIRNGVPMWGKVGTLVPGKRTASGSYTLPSSPPQMSAWIKNNSGVVNGMDGSSSTISAYQVTGLSFTPGYVILWRSSSAVGDNYTVIANNYGNSWTGTNTSHVWCYVDFQHESNIHRHAAVYNTPFFSSGGFIVPLSQIAGEGQPVNWFAVEA